MNPIPSNTLAFAITRATLPFDATSVLVVLVAVLAGGAIILACAAWWNRPRGVVPRSGVSMDLVVLPLRKDDQRRQLPTRGSESWPASAMMAHSAATARRAAGDAR